MTKTESMKEKRAKLATLSKVAKELIGRGPFADCETVNDCLVLGYARKIGLPVENFHSYKGWKEKGFHVRKGETGFPVWSKPMRFKKGEGEDEKEFSGFSIAHIFHSGQVELMDSKEAKEAKETTKKPKTTKDGKLAEKLEKLAHSMEKDIQNKLNPSIQSPTPRRIRIAESMREEGLKLQLAQGLLILSAQAWGSDTVGEVDSREFLEDFKVTSKKDALGYISNRPDLVEEYLRDAKLAPKKDEEGEIRRAVNELCGTKIDGFFPTPDAIADQMVELADFPPGLTSLLEPSAGYGALIDAAIRAHGDGRLEVTCFEVNHKLQEILRMKGHTPHRTQDFIEYASTERFDRVLMNPPFENGQDMMHTQIAYDKLNPGGVLVGIVCENCFYRNDGEYPEFREWLEELGAEVIDLPAGAFTGTIRTTNVKTRIIKLVKPHTNYHNRVAQLEAEGLTTSDAQGVADAEGLSPF